jgi:hypothetical protein
MRALLILSGGISKKNLAGYASEDHQKTAIKKGPVARSNRTFVDKTALFTIS